MELQPPAGPVEWVALTFPETVLDPRVVPAPRAKVDARKVLAAGRRRDPHDDDGEMTGRRWSST